MSQSHYETELDKLPDTYRMAIEADIDRLTMAIAGASDSSVIGVGSGGSFTVASLLCSLHETYTGRVSRPSTPLEIVCSPNLASSSPVFLISAEGKNPDIVEALWRARRHSARSLHILTNRIASPFRECADTLEDIGVHVFELTEKDGYLATNSLLLDAVLVARAYGQLNRDGAAFPATLAGLDLEHGTIDDWLSGAGSFVKQAASRGAVIVTFSPLLRSVAADLESKLSEAALLHCQLADLRSFAHGRHLWLAERPNDCVVLALIEPTLRSLWEATTAVLPTSVPTLTMPFSGTKPRDLLAGLVAQMRLIGAIAQQVGRDPARPNVPSFGRELHYVDLTGLIAAPTELSDGGEYSKYEVLGARWPALERRGPMRRALQNFLSTLQQQVFRAIVFDYDGTLCNSHPNDLPPPRSVIAQLRRLLDDNIVVGIATGRGGSIQDRLRESLPEALWSRVRIGLYNCGWMGDLATVIPDQTATSEFLSHVTRIVGRLKTLGVPIERIRATHPHQVSVRLRGGASAEKNWFVIADALRQAGLDVSKVVYSKHSVDILNDNVSKSHLIANIIQDARIHPHEILTMGDQGAWPGNDASLLEHRFSLSVDVPSRRLDRGWRLAPSHKRNVDAALWYLERIRVVEDGKFKFDPLVEKVG
jgi:HAD superfamily hydrolase (TIGR01484 family)